MEVETEWNHDAGASTTIDKWDDSLKMGCFCLLRVHSMWPKPVTQINVKFEINIDQFYPSYINILFI